MPRPCRQEIFLRRSAACGILPPPAARDTGIHCEFCRGSGCKLGGKDTEHERLKIGECTCAASGNAATVALIAKIGQINARCRVAPTWVHSIQKIRHDITVHPRQLHAHFISNYSSIHSFLSARCIPRSWLASPSSGSASLVAKPRGAWTGRDGMDEGA
jgi:hypothetical protein